MANPSSQVLTANRLNDGTVLYRKADGWVLTLAEADVYDDKPAAQAALDAATAGLTRNEYVSPYLFEVRRENGVIHPVKEREIIRAAGPSVRADLGKQAGISSPARAAQAGEVPVAPPAVRKAEEA